MVPFEPMRKPSMASYLSGSHIDSNSCEKGLPLLHASTRRLLNVASNALFAMTFLFCSLSCSISPLWVLPGT